MAEVLHRKIKQQKKQKTKTRENAIIYNFIGLILNGRCKKQNITPKQQGTAIAVPC